MSPPPTTLDRHSRLLSLTTLYYRVLLALTELVRLLTRMLLVFFFQAEDGIRDAQESRGLGDVYKRQSWTTRVSNLHNLAF